MTERRLDPLLENQLPYLGEKELERAKERLRNRAQRLGTIYSDARQVELSTLGPTIQQALTSAVSNLTFLLGKVLEELATLETILGRLNEKWEYDSGGLEDGNPGPTVLKN